AIRDLVLRSILGLAVFMPPRYGKSETCSVHFPAWYLGRLPHHRVILTGYGTDFASSFGRKVRDLLREHGPRVFGVSVRKDVTAANEWETIGLDGRPAGGGMLATGIGGGITGRGADCLIIDDPIKLPEEAVSKTIRDKHWAWYLSAADTRLEPNAIEL